MFHLKKWRHRNLHYSASNYTVIQWQNLNSVLIIPIKSAKGKGIECADVGECRVGIWIVKGHKGMRSASISHKQWIRYCVCVLFFFLIQKVK